MHLSFEHYVKVTPTTFTPLGVMGWAQPARVHQYVATTHAHRKAHVPSILITYDVSPLHLSIKEVAWPTARAR